MRSEDPPTLDVDESVQGVHRSNRIEVGAENVGFSWADRHVEDESQKF